MRALRNTWRHRDAVRVVGLHVGLRRLAGLTVPSETRFQFGENWRNYSQAIDEDDVAHSVDGLLALLPAESWSGRTVVDIGCGSGLHACAMIRLGVAELTATDFDSASVATTRQLLQDRTGASTDKVFVDDILASRLDGRKFDIVYSWGVLHHTGNMWGAIRNAADLVGESGHLAIAIYKKTPTCGFWGVEKRLFCRLSASIQNKLSWVFAGVLFLAHGAMGRKPTRDYRQRRGMRLWHDAKDWLGGFPYESAEPADIAAFVEAMGFETVKVLNDGRSPLWGLLGSGCAEYLFRRK